jgi:diacylglycerol kinase (ATP)
VPVAPIVIVNPTAGGGRAARLLPWLRERLEVRPDITVEVTRSAGHAEELARLAGRSGADRVVAVGGDGTIQEIVNGLCSPNHDASVALGIVPVGTGNDLARSLGLPTDPAEAWRTAMGRTLRRVDVARARNGDGRERYFASAGGIGFDAHVARVMADARGWGAGRPGYLLTALRELWRFENRAVGVSLDGGAPITGRVLFVAFANGSFYGGGMRIAPDARPDDGLLDVCVVGDISRAAALRQIPNLYRGTHVRHPMVAMHRAAVIDISGDAGTCTHLDGEPFGGLPLRVTLESGRLEVAAP